MASLFTKPTAEQQGLIGRLTYAIPLLIAFFLLLKGVSNQPAPGIGLKQLVYPLYLSDLPETFTVMVTGLVLVILGLLLGLWARAVPGSTGAAW